MSAQGFNLEPNEFPLGWRARLYPRGFVDVNRHIIGQLAVRSALVALVLTQGGCAWDTPMTTLIPRSDFASEILH